MNTWFQDARFGMFLHWGVYSARGHGECAYNRERIQKEEKPEWLKTDA